MTIQTSTSGATIHYTVGTTAAMPPTPTASDPGGNSPYRLNLRDIGVGEKVIKAIAVKGDRASESETTVTLTITLLDEAAAPSFSVSGGTGSALARGVVYWNQRLEITSSIDGASIYYTTDGTDPRNADGSRVPYENALLANGNRLGANVSLTLRAIAVHPDYASSEETTMLVHVAVEGDVDEDNDGLIEIKDLNMFDTMRHKLDGTSYKAGSSATDNTTGIPMTMPAACMGRTAPNKLCGYELIQDLDFSMGAHYESGTVDSTWRPDGGDPDTATNGGFLGFGAEDTSATTGGFSAIFEGNGYVIKKLYTRGTGSAGVNIGLFRFLQDGGIIRNVGVTEVNVYGGGGFDYVGALVGRNNGNIVASHSTGSANGESGTNNVGGLVGGNQGGVIIASYSSTDVEGGTSFLENIGGLVGFSDNNSTIITSYASGNPDGGGGSDYIGGLVGNNAGTITASYASGNPGGGGRTSDLVGGLVGQNSGTITGSYAVSTFTRSSSSGALIGVVGTGSSMDSYGFNPSFDGDNSPPNGNTKPRGVTMARQLTEANTPASWTTSYWNFGNDMQNPALIYNDYDGDGTAYPSCSENNGGFAAVVPGTSTPLVCGESLIGGQR